MSKVSIACIALLNGKILVAHRNPTGQMGGRWEFPGGKVEPGETDKEAVVREIKEEFGITVVDVGKKIAETSFIHNEEKVLLHAYRIYVPHDGIEKKYTLTEHTEYNWIPAEDVAKLNFVDSDLLLYPKVKSYILEELKK